MTDRKRKAEEIPEEQLQESKKQLLEEAANQSGDDDYSSVPDTEATREEQPEPEVAGQTEPAPEQKTADAPPETASTEEPSNVPTLETVIPFKRLILLNIEATCDENATNPAAVQVTKENSEAIELAFVVVDASNLEVLHKQQIYIRPERTPLTNFCTTVTGITWDKLESAGTLKDAIDQLDTYIRNEIEAKDLSFCFVTHGGWTLRIQLPREARDKNIELPQYLAFSRLFDLKQEMQRWQLHHPEVSLRAVSIREMCDTFHLERVTEHTVGLNACLSTVNVMRYLTGFRHPDVFVNAIDTNADLQQFKKEESKVIHLACLPYEVTQGELEAWFSSNGLRPTVMWMIQPTDHSKPSISGFVVFSFHADAMRALQLNGRCLGDKAVEVSPSSERVIEAAGNMLAPFPTQAKTRQLRPGDWNCPNCDFHNFASRRNCFKCNAENPNPAAAPTPHHSSFHHPNYVAGDWNCPNSACGFHNYASRVQCLKCGAPRPHGAGSGGHHHASMPPPMAGGYGGPRPSPHISFRPGDWYCPNPNCGFQNFASRATCLRCHSSNPNSGGSSGYSPQPGNYGGYNPADPGYNSSSTGYSGGYGGAPPAPGSSYGGGYGAPMYGGGHPPVPGGHHHGSSFRPGDWYW
ncbi:uncharacterized protein BYT42DRAFT_494108 [Radiomyces spectabilis]|uniref:uncharacterized protein n=1 Tax=Radiomyces spectabilis TaxID=64574 RepID=UPI00221EF573|nr:uncharacterized protein BYT42DRAFT_494108 [Radiomyces spectabilis]KAI8381504.1 hypothetical protein BYT42DRAFT_494108 [Radiomyces spectabilis]